MSAGTSIAAATGSRVTALLPVALFVLALLLLAAPADAGAAATGNTTLLVSAGKAKKLKKRGIALTGIRGAITEGRETRLQIVDGTVANSEARLVNGGGLRLVAGKGKNRRVVRLTALQTLLGARSSLTGKLNGKERVLLDIKAKPGRLALDGLRGTAALNGGRLVWRKGAVRKISKLLRVAVPKGTLGTVRSGAVATATSTPVSGPISNDPLPPLARPATAIDITSATTTWWVRSSWVNYVATGAGTSAVEGAVPGSPIVENAHPCLDDSGGDPEARIYDFTFPLLNGWYDPPTGTAAIYGSGGVRFSFPGHGIDFTTRNPELEFNGTASRVIFRLRGGGSTAYPDSRVALLDLRPTAPAVEGPPGTFTYAAAATRTYLTTDGLSVFGGYYAPPNHGFGCFAVSFTVPTM